LVQNWEFALDGLVRLKDIIDAGAFSHPLHQLQERIWLIHWGLFVFFRHPKGLDAMFEILFSPLYINAIQTSCPYILRYLAAAVIIGRRKRNFMKELIKSSQQDSYRYQDTITRFIEYLFVRFDFDMAQSLLQECEEILQNDFFLALSKDEFIDSARSFLLEAYCKVHQVVHLDIIASKLNMDVEEAENWINNLIQNARLDTKLNLEQRQIIVTSSLSTHQHVLEKAKNLMFRGQNLLSEIDKSVVGLNPGTPVMVQSEDIE
jgi:translation initiation factor 3 subunit E